MDSQRLARGYSPPAGSGGRRGAAQTLVVDRQGEARSILRLRALGGGGRQERGRYVEGRARRDDKGIEAVRGGGGEADSGHVCRIDLVLQAKFFLSGLGLVQCGGVDRAART